MAPLPGQVGALDFGKTLLLKSLWQCEALPQTIKAYDIIFLENFSSLSSWNANECGDETGLE